ncbi:hypothetical protein BHS05_26360 [Myxococcus xanthus]|nr:hypothetical protein BHS05_26360 [Myxococcus xanthus]
MHGERSWKLLEQVDVAHGKFVSHLDVPPRTGSSIVLRGVHRQEPSTFDRVLSFFVAPASACACQRFSRVTWEALPSDAVPASLEVDLTSLRDEASLESPPASALRALAWSELPRTKRVTTEFLQMAAPAGWA